jgi:hypothetical protein
MKPLLLFHGAASVDDHTVAATEWPCYVIRVTGVPALE